MSITRTDRAKIAAYLATTVYDASTMRIAKDGMVTALKDADKTYSAPETTRYNVGYADELLREAM